jgi:hypothetical protein
LVFNGGWTHTSTGAKSNGTNASADTKLLPSVVLTQWNTHLSLYSRTATLQSSNIDMASSDGAAINLFSLTLPRTTGNGGSTQYSQTNSSEMALASGLTDASGFWMSNRTSNVGSSHKFLRNGLILGTATTSAGSLVPYSVNIGSLNGNYFSNKEFAFSSIGDGLTDSESANFYTSVQKFQTTLGRQVGTPAVSDSDAQAFLNAAGITDLTQAGAINTLVTDLKTAGIWTKMKAIYPFVGGTATSHKFNLKDSRDLDTAFRLIFNGGWTHASTGAKPNGTTGYADTKFTPSTNLTANSAHQSFYFRTNKSISSNTAVYGAYTNFGSNNFLLYPYSFGIGWISDIFDNSTSRIVSNAGDSTGHIIATRASSSSHKMFRNNSVIASTTNATTGTYPSINYYIGAGNKNGTPGDYDNNELAFSSLGDGLTDSESSAFYTAVQKYQSTLGRQIGVPIVSDSDAQSFLNAAGITDTLQASAINTLVTDLKSSNIWSKMKAIYPFVGGSSTTHKWNLKDPRDLDVAYRLTFNGGMSHDSRGIVPNGTTGYANTFIDPYVLAINSGFGYYSQTNNTTNSADIGAISYNMSNPPTYSPTRLFQIANSGTTKYVGISSDVSISYSDTDTRGFYQGWRSDSSTIKSMKGTSLLSTAAPYLSTTVYSNGMRYFIGGRYEGGIMQTPSSRVLSFSYFQENFNDTDAQNLYTAVQKFQTTLGRQIGTPVGTSNMITTGLILNLDASNPTSYSGTGTTWFDISGSGKNATLNNGVTYSTNNGGALVFDGINDYVVTNTSTSDMTSGQITIDIWFKANSFSNQIGLYQFANELSSGLPSILAQFTNYTGGPNTAQVRYYINGGYVMAHFVHESNIQNITLTYESGVWKAYLNGVLQTTWTSGFISYGTSKFWIGNGYNGYTSINNYSMRIYNKGLTSKEVLQNFNATKSRFGL